MKEDGQEYFSLSMGQVTITEIIQSIKTFLEEFPDSPYSVVIGSDSQERTDTKTGKRYINLITAIVVYRRGFGGKYFWKKKLDFTIHSLREKVYAETLASLDFATMFVPSLQKALNGSHPHYDLEIHVDVGEGGETREMIKEVVGMVTGYGFVAKTKPLAYVASNIADKHT